MKKGYKALLAEAEAEIEALTPAEAAQLIGREDIVFVDIREPAELAREGAIPGAQAMPRGVLEFWIDPESPYHKPIFASGKTFVFFCAPAGARLWRPRWRRTWGLHRSSTLPAGSQPGRRRGCRYCRRSADAAARPQSADYQRLALARAGHARS